jgi:hypothetical protein
VLLALVLALTAAGCSGDDQSSTPDEPSSSETKTAEKSLPQGLRRSTIEIGQVAGRLPRRERRELVAEVGATVDRWFDRAWLSAPLPRKADPFPAFTPAAERQARKERQVTTIRAVERPLGGVVPRTRSIRLDVLAPGGRPHAVTARIHLGVAAYDKKLERLEGRVVVSGRLMLAPVGKRWMVFGYDLATSTPGETGTMAGGKAKRDRSRGKDGKRDRERDRTRDRKEARR